MRSGAPGGVFALSRSVDALDAAPVGDPLAVWRDLGLPGPVGRHVPAPADRRAEGGPYAAAGPGKADEAAALDGVDAAAIVL
jgi:hypothetical protein